MRLDARMRINATNASNSRTPSGSRLPWPTTTIPCAISIAALVAYRQTFAQTIRQGADTRRASRLRWLVHDIVVARLVQYQGRAHSRQVQRNVQQQQARVAKDHDSLVYRLIAHSSGHH